MDTIFKTIGEAYHIQGELVSVTPMKRGHINDTYCVNFNEDGKEKSYLFQRINSFVFKEPEQIMRNVEQVTTHIRHKLEMQGCNDVKRMVMKPYKHDDGYLYVTENGEYWRVMSFIFSATTYDDFDIPRLKAIGHGFGRFLAMLSDFPGGDLFETIPNFHNTRMRYDALYKSFRDDPKGRAKDVAEEMQFIRSTYELSGKFQQLYNEGKLPLRVTHNDTKGNNIMIDIATGSPLAVIDLDTVMPGFAMNDFGDAVRYAANTAAEDEPDITKVSLDMARFDALAEGFLTPMAGKLTVEEIENMPYGVIMMTLELAVRFFKDYLDGDVYFKIGHPTHNLERARCQLALAKDMMTKLDDMKEITDKYLKK